MAISKKVLGGCGIGCVGLIAIGVIVGFFGYRFAKGKFDEFTGEFENKGWKRQMAQVMVVGTPPKNK